MWEDILSYKHVMDTHGACRRWWGDFSIIWSLGLFYKPSLNGFINQQNNDNKVKKIILVFLFLILLYLLICFQTTRVDQCSGSLQSHNFVALSCIFFKTVFNFGESSEYLIVELWMSRKQFTVLFLWCVQFTGNVPKLKCIV